MRPAKSELPTMRDKGERKEKLSAMWKLTADGIIKALSAEAPSAAALNAARQFLNDNGVTLEVLRDWKQGAGFDAGPLPTFADESDDSDTPPSNPLKAIPPFANE